MNENDKIPIKNEKNINYITVPDGDYEGVSYKINNVEVIEDEKGNFLKFDYDVKGLNEGDEKEFEHYLGDFIIKSLEDFLETNKGKEI